jgi:DNA-binding NtrC family response regulator
MTCDANDTFCELERQNFDILLLDLNMPNLNSLETYRRIKKLRPDIITILMTGYAEQMNDMIDYTIDDGAYTVLPKPINVEQLLNLLQQITAEKSKGNRKKSGTER